MAGELETKEQRTQRLQSEVLPVSDARRVRESLAALTVFAIDVFVCPRCGGRRRLVGVHPGREHLQSLLERLGLGSASPAAEPSRSPPRTSQQPDRPLRRPARGRVHLRGAEHQAAHRVEDPGLYLLGEGAGEWIGARDKVSHPLWKRVWHLALLLGMVVLVAIAAGEIVRMTQ